MPPEGQSPHRYRAFISYSHADAAAAAWLHRALERYRVPRALVGRETPRGTVPARLIPIFRDREELSASTDLTGEIRAALAGSAQLIVLCSPRSARSRWVNEEILTFKRQGGEDRIFAVILEGEPGSDDPALQCFPPALRFRLGADGELSDQPTEPIAADAREVGDGRDGALLKLIAGLLGVGLDALKQREARARRRRLAFAYGLAGLFAVLAAASLWFAITAERQRARAEGNLHAGIEAANTVIFDIVDVTRNLAGIQQKQLAGVLKKTEELLEALADGQTLPLEGQRTMAAAQISLSTSLLSAGDSAGSLAAAEKAVTSLRALVAAAPEDNGYASDLAIALSRAAAATQVRGDFAGAEARLAEAETILANLAATQPSDMSFRRLHAAVLEQTGDLAEAAGDSKKALDVQQRALDIRRKLAAEAGEDEGYQQDLSISLDRVGDLKLMAGDSAGALAAF